MRVAITGATGNVGTSLLRSLSADEQVSSIVGIARRVPDAAADLPKVSWVAADVADDDLAPHFAAADAVVHLAWLFQPTHRPAVTWAVNAVGSRRVFDAAAAAGVSTLVYASSVGAYSPGSGRQVAEDWPTDGVPVAAYSREKAYVERVLDAFEARRPDIRVVRLRPAFIFQRRAASQQRRLFAGPFIPNWLARPGLLPRLPIPAGLCFQAVHADDAATAYRLALTSSVRGAFNVAAEPAIDARALAALLGTRERTLPPTLVRSVASLAWHAHLSPADPALLDLVLTLPLLDTTRIRTELGWAPQRSGVDAVRDMLAGFESGSGGPTPPLAPDSVGGRVHEIVTGVGEQD